MSSSLMLQVTSAIASKSKNFDLDKKVKHVVDGVEIEAKAHHPLKGKMEGGGRDPSTTLTPFWRDKKKTNIDSLAKNAQEWYKCNERGCNQVCKARSAIYRHIRDACPGRNARLQLLDFKLKTFDPEDDVAGPLGPQPSAGSELVNKFRERDVSKKKAKGATKKTVEADGDSSQQDLSISASAPAWALAAGKRHSSKRKRNCTSNDEDSTAGAEKKFRKMAIANPRKKR